MKKFILLLYGGMEESEISCISAKYIRDTLSSFLDMEIIPAYLTKSFDMFQNEDFSNRTFLESQRIEFSIGSILINNKKIKIDYCIPCIHGQPGENGDIQPILEFYKIPYLGNNSETSKMCFNKITTKLWIEKIGIPTTPYEIVTEYDDEDSIIKKYHKLGEKVFIKTSSQGSSIGCYPANDLDSLKNAIKQSRQYGPYTLIEKSVRAREIEIAVFEYKNELVVTKPGEVLNQHLFYSYDAKYSSTSTAKTTLNPPLTIEEKEIFTKFSKIIFKALKLKDLSRIDYFLLESGEIYLNEINTFPGLTKISLFPQLLETSNLTFKNYLVDRINNLEK